MFGALIKEYRRALNISQEEMAYTLGVSPNHLSKIELGKTNPSGKLIERILSIIANDNRVLKVSVENTDLYSIILLIAFERINTTHKKFVFEQMTNLINWINEHQIDYNRTCH